ncbi:MAG: M15 family metallopeptidase [Rhodothermia bacterium]|nr:M15 family metallopeptidase [Rhodothermia bacterium]
MNLTLQLVLLLGAVASNSVGPIPPTHPGPNLVDVSKLDPTIVIDMRYAGPDNFVGQKIDGYESAVCLLTPHAAEALTRVNRDLSGLGYRLVVFDCYRPQRAVDHFVRWSRYPLETATKEEYYPRVEKKRLFSLGYIASRSGHSRGSTVDAGLMKVDEDSAGSVRLTPVDMGTPFDFFDERSHTDAPGLTPDQRMHRDLLRSVMDEYGFRNYRKEWWHFTLRGEPFPDSYFDVVVRESRR